MTIQFVLPAALAVLVAQAEPLQSDLNLSTLQVPDAAPAQVFRSASWRAFDPSIDVATEVATRRFRFGDTQLLRGTPTVDGIPVEGADRWVMFRKGTAQRWHRGAVLERRSQFLLDEGQATLAATQSVPASLIRDATVERSSGLARPVWLSRADGLYAAYRVRVPTLSLRELSDVYVDGQSGRILQRVPVARFADAPTAAKVFRYAPPSAGVDPAALVDVELSHLRPAAPGDYLRGDYVETFNCCKEYVCDDGSGTCELSAQRCARDDDSDPVTSELALQIPTENLPLPGNLNLGDVLYARTVFCAELPRARSTEAGWVETPVDVTRGSNELAGLASEEDAFAEVQAYYATMTFFEHIRDVLDDTTWCLGGKSMQCDESGLPLLGDDGAPARAFHVSTNLLIPELEVAGLAQQLLAGKGRSEADPIVVEDFQRIDNAAFVPALSGSPVEVPEEFAALVEIFNRDFDSNLYFQGSRDFAYDGDIVFHEFTHAVVHSYVPELGSLWHDEQGANAESGALNEGWSDYFAASFTGDSATGEYGGAAITGGELGLRDADNDKRCPEDLSGEVHDDSEPWSGALWDLRAAVIAALGEEAVRELDQALLLALAESEVHESFALQASRVIDVVESVFGAELKLAAEAAFEAHNLSACVRVQPLSVLREDGDVDLLRKDRLFVSSPVEVGTTDLAPAVVQFRVEVPAGATAFALDWKQQGGGLASQFTGPADPVVLQVVTLEDERPIGWTYDGESARPVDADGGAIDFDPVAPESNALLGSANSNGIASATYRVALDPDACAPRVFHVQLVNRRDAVVATDITVSVEAGETSCDEEGASEQDPADEGSAGCACDARSSNTELPLFAAALLGWAFHRRRRR